MLDFTGRVAVVTGAAMGMGNATARLLAKQGATVCLLDISDGVEVAARELVDSGYKAYGYKVNVTDQADVYRVFDNIVAEHGLVDHLVNSAGIARLSSMFDEQADANLQAMIDVNVIGLWNTSKAALRSMVEKKKGSIVNFSSVTGTFVADAHEVGYAATKSAVWGMTKAMCMEFVTEGVRVNMVCPGMIRTPMVEKSAAEMMPDNPEAVLSAIGASVPMGRMGTPEEAANAVAFLLSDEASYITGREIVFDGASTLPETNVTSD
ncbi:SDR family oxidoreductase [Endozoicomonas gorgoniicola]|uniref:SDR family oxidoreductase n=1 Tax=Endozoicomonas gorgoniicola TaxID=1234144 RepID=A0ABT3MWY1_9GAMM|nr:SDR family oxidoreductase [Endozoicomonas gorgoniicola]MCW7553890.1 SDR family oxidoreductase [Endozoicomonas gorgoniicola]